jgi:tRNA wybutosine-synthesizing protein 1
MDALPTQLYVSVTASDEELFSKINRSVCKDGWARLNKTLGIMAKLKCRRVIRFTLIKGMNDDDKYIKQYARLFEKSKADYIEVKAFMFLGQSRKRLKQENMPSHADVRAFAARLAKAMGNYRMHNEHELSRIVLLKRNDSKVDDRIISVC